MPVLDDAQAQLFCVTLSVTSQALRQRLQRDIDAGLRQPDIVERSLARLPLYRELSTRKVDVSDLSQESRKKLADYIDLLRRSEHLAQIEKKGKQGTPPKKTAPLSSFR